MIPLTTALTRLALALVLGAIIGIEREWRHKTAGIKTNTLVALGAATFALLSNTFGDINHNPAQIAAAVVTGIGFIGAGVIIHRGATVQGVTTAATLWANASMGVAVGLGQFNVGATLFAAIIVTQFTMRTIGTWIDAVRREGRMSRVELCVECEHEAVRAIDEAWSRFAREAHATTMRRSISRGDLLWTRRTTFIVPSNLPLDVTPLEEQLAAIDGVHSIEVRFLGYQEAPDAVM